MHCSRRGILAAVALLAFLVPSGGRFVQAAEASPGKLVIVTAVYGDLDGEKTLDVTAKVTALVKDNCLTVAANNATLGEPPVGGPKKLKVGYTVDGIYRSKTANQGEVLDISLRLVIRKAVYGDLPNGAMADVTDQVADLVRKNSLTVDATNDRFGDPADGRVKRLKVDYTLDGVDKSQTVDENQSITIIAPPAAKAPAETKPTPKAGK